MNDIKPLIIIEVEKPKDDVTDITGTHRPGDWKHIVPFGDYDEEEDVPSDKPTP